MAGAKNTAKVQTFLPLAVFFCLLAGIAIYRYTKHNHNMDDKTLRVSFSSLKPLSRHDPLKIFYAVDYVLLENLFSPLIQYAPDGELVSAIAEKFEWEGTEAVFTIRNGLRTIDGREIDAFDVEQTFKRMLIIGGNTHGDLRDMLCPGVTMKNMNDSCPGIMVRSGGRKFVMKFPEIKPFLFPMLARIDFAIIPRGSIDKTTLAINDFRNTSGPYYVEKESPEGTIDLLANPAHFAYREKMPQRVSLVRVDNRDMKKPLELFSEGKVDHIPTVDLMPADVKINYARGHKDVNLHETYPLRVMFVIFTKKGLATLSEKERMQIGTNLRHIFFSRRGSLPGYERAEQVFSLDGALPVNEMEEIRKKFKSAGDPAVIKKKMLAWNLNEYFKDEVGDLKALFPNTESVSSGKITALVNFEKEGITEPEFYIFRTDTGFHEDIGLLSYYFTINLFDLDPDRKQAWMRNYTATGDKEQRMEMLKKLHFRILSEAIVIPISITPYTSLLRKPWFFDFSELHANNPLWRIHHD